MWCTRWSGPSRTRSFPHQASRHRTCAAYKTTALSQHSASTHMPLPSASATEAADETSSVPSANSVPSASSVPSACICRRCRHFAVHAASVPASAASCLQFRSCQIRPNLQHCQPRSYPYPPVSRPSLSAALASTCNRATMVGMHRAQLTIDLIHSLNQFSTFLSSYFVQFSPVGLCEAFLVSHEFCQNSTEQQKYRIRFELSRAKSQLNYGTK